MYDRYLRFYNTAKEIETLTARKLTDDENPCQRSRRTQARFDAFYEYTMKPLMQEIGKWRRNC